MVTSSSDPIGKSFKRLSAHFTLLPFLWSDELRRMVLITIGLLATVLSGIYVFCYFKYRWSRKIAGVGPTVPVFGNGLQFANQNSFKIFQNMTRVFHNEHRIFKLHFGPIPVVCPNHPDLLQKVLTDTATLNKPFVYKFLRLDHGLTAGKCKYVIESSLSNYGYQNRNCMPNLSFSVLLV